MFRRLVTVLLGLSAGCAANQAPVIDLSQDVRLPPAAAVLFFVDGMDRGRFQELLRAGELPNMREIFVEGGVGVRHAVTSMPAVTYPNSVSLLTGCFPGHHGIVGNSWFDRRTLELQDYIHLDSFYDVNGHFDRRTIYEILDDHLTVGVQFHTHRGVTRTFDNALPAGIDWCTHNFSGVDERVGRTLEKVVRLANRRGCWPTLSVYYFPGVDEIGHRYGADSARYAQALQVADGAIGAVCDAVADSPLAQRTTLILMTDHSHVPSPPQRHFAIARWLEEQGLEVRTERLRSKSYRRRERQMSKYDAVLISGAGRRAVIHLRGPDGWADPPEPERRDELIARLVRQPAVDAAVSRFAPHRVHVASARGAATVQRSTGGRSPLYRVLNHRGDPLGVAATPALRAFAGGQWHDSRSWLRATCATDYPDFVPQVVEMFDSPRAGDIVVFAAEDWSFDDWRGGHGSCLASDMCVPLFLAGPHLAPGAEIDCARVVDIMPTVLDLLGEAQRLENFEPIDGHSFAEALRNARTPIRQSVHPPGRADSVLSHAAVQSHDVQAGHLGSVEPGG